MSVKTVENPLRMRFGDSDRDVADLRMDASTHSIQTMSYEHHEIHSGSHYFVVGYQDIPQAGDVLDFTWLIPDSPKEIHWIWSIEVDSEILWQVYEGAVASNPLANAVTPLNSNRNSPKTSATTMKFEIQADLATANADTNVTTATLIESGKIGDGKQSGGNIGRSNELIMKRNTLYCLRATATAAGYIAFNMQWYEHTPKD